MASSLALTNLVSYNLLPKSLHATRQAIPASRLFSTYEKINYWGGPNHQWKHNNSGPVQGPNEHWEHNSRRPVQGPNEHWECNCNPWGPNQYPWQPGNPWGLNNQYPRRPGRWPEEHWEHNPCGPDQHLADSSDSFFSINTSLRKRLKMMNKFMDSPYRHATTYRGILPGHWEARETDDGFYIRMYMSGLAKKNVYITGKHNYMSIGEVSGNDNRAWRISTTIDLPLKFYKSDQIKAEMKNGVLNIVVLKSEKEERDEEFHVNVE